MLIAAFGDCHGKIDRMWKTLAALEEEVGREVDLVLQVGDFGVWPDPLRLDKATKRHGGPGDFFDWYKNRRAMPRPTIFIPGNHEDFAFLGPKKTCEILPQLTFLAWGETTTFSSGGEEICIGGLGGCFGGSDYPRAFVSGLRRRHYLRHEIDRLIESPAPIDILLLHDAPPGDVHEVAPGHNKKTSRAEGLDELITATKPALCFTGHFHYRTERQIHETRTIGLSIVNAPGCALLFDYDPSTRTCTERAEWQRPIGQGAGAVPHEAPFLLSDTEKVARETRLAYPSNLSEMALVLEEWAAVVRDGVSLNRGRRMALYEALAGHPMHRLLMQVLNKKDTLATLQALVSAEEAQAYVDADFVAQLPDARPLQQLVRG